MNALTMHAGPNREAGLRPVPWRRMAWVTWRQHRATLGGLAVFLGALAVYLSLAGLLIHHAYAADCHPASSVACTLNFTGRYATTANVVSIFLQAVPALIGAFAGAPVLGREMETGTFRYAWTQGFGRWRWTLAKLVLLAVVLTAAAGAFSALFSWYTQPFFAVGYTNPFDTRLFALRGVAFAAWALAAFAIGALAGMLIRRVVPTATRPGAAISPAAGSGPSSGSRVAGCSRCRCCSSPRRSGWSAAARPDPVGLWPGDSPVCWVTGGCLTLIWCLYGKQEGDYYSGREAGQRHEQRGSRGGHSAVAADRQRG